MHYFYIIYSRSINQYYVGESENTTVRLQQHNTGHFKGSSTSKAKDWEIVLQVPCKDRSEARKLERFVKKQKSKKFIESIIDDKNKLTNIIDRVLSGK